MHLSADVLSVQPCALCGEAQQLARSHVIPQFVYRWQFATLETARQSHGEKMSRRESDGPTQALLCRECEREFSRHESEFAREVFHPFMTTASLHTKYGAWLRQFAASVCWRILTTQMTDDVSGQFASRWSEELHDCRATWQNYLTGKQPDVGAHHLHLLRWSDLADEADALPPPRALSRDSSAQIDFAIACAESAAFVYAKLGPLVLFGLIEESDSKSWQGTRINAEGKLKPREVRIPDVYRDFVRARERRK